MLPLLHVDDDATMRAIVALAMARDGGFAVTGVASGDAALTLVATGFHPAVALLDISLPGSDGRSLQAHLYAALPDVPTIFMTALARTTLDAPGVIGTIVKPFDPLRLADTVRALLAQRIVTR